MSRSFIFNDSDLNNLLISRENKEYSKKAFILYFFTIHNIKDLFDIIYLPESVLDNAEFTKMITNVFPNIGYSINPNILCEDKDLIITENPLNKIISYSKYNFKFIHYPVQFGKRNVNKSPKNEEYIIHSQYNWTNVHLINQYCQSHNIKLLVEPILDFAENSSEDYYIHMRQVFWEGIDLFRRLSNRFNTINILIPPFYPKLKGLRDNEILDAANIGNTTLRCITECLTKEKIDIYIKPCKEFSIQSYKKYILFFKNHNKENNICPLFTVEIMKEYLKDWNFQESQLKFAQEKFTEYLLP